MQIVVGALIMVTKGLEKGPREQEIRGRIETIQTIKLLKSAEILCSCLLDFSEKLPVKIGVKNSPEIK